MGHSKSLVHSLPNAYFASTEKSHPFWLLPIEFAHKAMLKYKAVRGGPEWVTGPVGVWDSEKVWRSLEKGGNLEKGRWEVKVLDEVSYTSFLHLIDSSFPYCITVVLLDYNLATLSRGKRGVMISSN